MKLFPGIIFCVLMQLQPLHAQQLDSILPVFKLQGNADSLIFILTSSDYNLWQGRPVKYASSIQIIDAGQPWPPHWYATSPVDKTEANGKSGRPFINAFQYNGNLVFTNAFLKKFPGGQRQMQDAVLTCNSSFEVTDTFYKPGLEMDVHDFAINNRGEKLYFLVADTLVNMRSFLKGARDSMVAISYEKIQIDDSHNKTIFSWNPVENLGPDAVYQPYCNEKSVINKSLNFEWSHGNSLCFDKDGNILYSYKYIGIGKIDRTDGHLIWHVDRNKLRPTTGSDSLPIFLQHDLNFVNDGKQESTYTVLSNGDSLYRHCAAYQFTVLPGPNGASVKIIKAFTQDDVPETGAGNFEVNANGDYIINYGLYRGDTLPMHILFDYRNPENKLLARYTASPQAFCYRVRTFSNSLPPRPVVVEKNGMLTVKSETKNVTWYELSGKNFEIVTRCSNATRFKPGHHGNYCVAVKQGIGYLVSSLYKYDR
jgi:Arylsulfotransferase (ASST)